MSAGPGHIRTKRFDENLIKQINDVRNFRGASSHVANGAPPAHFSDYIRATQAQYGQYGLNNSILSNIMPGMVPFPNSGQTPQQAQHTPAGLSWNIPHGTQSRSPPGTQKENGLKRSLPPYLSGGPQIGSQYVQNAGPPMQMSKEMGNLLANSTDAMKLHFEKNMMQSILFKGAHQGGPHSTPTTLRTSPDKQHDLDRISII